jgi:hypothetical protein
MRGVIDSLLLISWRYIALCSMYNSASEKPFTNSLEKGRTRLLCYCFFSFAGLLVFHLPIS